MGFFSRKSKNKESKSDTTLVPGVGRLPYPAYQGDEPYIFISYSHADSERVFAEIKRFNEAGYHVWYDEGISPGNEWDDEIAEALENCSLFIVFLTQNSVNSRNVKNEIDFAIDDGIPAIGIYLEPCALKRGLKLRFQHAQAIMKYTITDEEEYVYKFTKAFAKYGINSQKPIPATALDSPDAAANRTVKAVTENKPQPTVDSQNRPQQTNQYNDSPEDAQKRANGNLVRVDGFDIEHGSLKGYFGTDKNLIIPNSATVIPSTAFKNCRLFVESIDLNRAGCVLDYAFENCPNLHTLKVPPTVTMFKSNAIVNCPNVTLYIRRDQLPEGYESRFTGKKIIYLDEPKLAPSAPVVLNAASKPPVQTSSSAQPTAPEIDLPANEHKWGNYIPKGTAVITTKDGAVHRAVANSLVFLSNGIGGRTSWAYVFSGIQTLNKDGKAAGEMIYFSDMDSVRNDGSKLIVTDIDDEETEIELHPEAKLWFIGDNTKTDPETVLATNIASITFDRTQTPDIKIRFGTVTTSEGSFLTPVPYIWFFRNVGRGIPHLTFTKDISSISPSPLQLKRVKKITVTQNGREGTMISASTNMEMKALLRNGDELKLVLSDRYEGFFAMSSGGFMRGLSRSNLREIDLFPSDT